MLTIHASNCASEKCIYNECGLHAHVPLGQGSSNVVPDVGPLEGPAELWPANNKSGSLGHEEIQISEKRERNKISRDERPRDKRFTFVVTCSR